MYPRTYAQYTLLERLATGGMSEVDLARRSIEDADYVRFLVIKRIRANHVEDDAFVRMFKDEARITSELRHTHIAQVYDFGRVDDEYYLALEYVPGTDLRAVLRRLKARGERMPVRMALKFAADVLSALHYAHTRTDPLGQAMEIVHRDVNPRNVMVSVAGEIKLIDFGVAKATDRLERTQTDHFKGKIAYMAPEQVQGRDLDHRVDIFAMGLTVYEMLTGRGVFSGLDQTQILYKLIQGELPRLDVPRAWGAAGRQLRSVVDKALQHEAGGRYASAEAMKEAVVTVAEAFGGMPDQQELAAWIGTIEPDLESQLRDKMKAWSGPLPEPRPTDELPAPPPTDASSTIDRAAVTEPATASSLTRNVMVAAGLGTAGVGALAVVVVTAVIVVVVGFWWMSPVGPSTPPAPTVVSGSAAPDADPQPSSPLSIGLKNRRPDDAIDAEPDTTPRPRPARPATAQPEPSSPEAEPVAPEGQGSAEPDPAAPVADPATVEPEPAAVAPEPEPPAPVAAATGKLQVTAAKKGVVILIDGKPTGHKTGDEFRWPVGTYTVSAEGLSPKTVSVREGMVQFVPLKP